MSDLSKELAEQWRLMSEEERDIATKDGIDELKERREMRVHAQHNVPIQAFHDAHTNAPSFAHASRSHVIVEVAMNKFYANVEKLKLKLKLRKPSL